MCMVWQNTKLFCSWNIQVPLSFWTVFSFDWQVRETSLFLTVRATLTGPLGKELTSQNLFWLVIILKNTNSSSNCKIGKPASMWTVADLSGNFLDWLISILNFGALFNSFGVFVLKRVFKLDFSSKISIYENLLSIGLNLKSICNTEESRVFIHSCKKKPIMHTQKDSTPLFSV